MIMRDNSSERFQFGKNWQAFLAGVNETHILKAEESLKQMLGVETLKGKTFIDVGCGSGLFSLAAIRLGAKKVHSFDFDAASVACTKEMKNRFAPNALNWQIEQGDVLDTNYLQTLGQYDVVYSWGVLHHTGQLWQALANVRGLVAKSGFLFLAIYNAQGRTSKMWGWVKKTYNQLPPFLRFLVLWPAAVVLWGPRTLLDLLQGKPFDTWKTYAKNRGMSAWYDLIDWVGGYPFEVAKPEEIFNYYYTHSFTLHTLITCGGGLGCNQFVFIKK